MQIIIIKIAGFRYFSKSDNVGTFLKQLKYEGMLSFYILRCNTLKIKNKWLSTDCTYNVGTKVSRYSIVTCYLPVNPLIIPVTMVISLDTS